MIINIKKHLTNLFFKDFIIFDHEIIDKNTKSISDFFYYDVKNFNTSFTLDNNFSILDAKKHLIDIDLHVYDRDGNLCLIKNFVFDDYFKVIDFKRLANEVDEFGGFFFSLNSKHYDILKFRGYSHYYCKKNKITSSVHGNFGGISFDKSNNKLISLAKKSNKVFYYTPQTLLKQNQKFIFLNHYNSDIKIELCIFDIRGQLMSIDFISLPAMGTSFFDTNKYLKYTKNKNDSIPTFKTNSPHMRPLILERYTSSFDIHHG